MNGWRKQSWIHVVWKIIPNGWSRDQEGPDTDGGQSDGRDLQTTGVCRVQHSYSEK